MNIAMSAAEASLFRQFLNVSTAYFEFGAGGTTVEASKSSIIRAVSVESDALWIEKIAENTIISQCKPELIYCDIGPTGAWGFPTSTDHRYKYPNYSRTILNCRPEAFDLCLVDGRFRVACFLRGLQALRPDAVIGVHDYRSRTEYHVIEEFGRPIAEVENLTFFVRRFNSNSIRISSLLDVYEFDSR